MGLKEGQRIKSKANGYTLVIPSFSEPLVQDFHQEASTQAGSVTGKQRVEKLLSFVYNNIKAEKDWERGAEEVSLLSSLGLRKGVCKEKAAALSVLLTLDGIDNDYKRGLVPDENDELERHAWVKVKVGDEYWLADPSYGPRFGKYNNVTRNVGYSEDKNFLKRALETLKKKNN